MLVQAVEHFLITGTVYAHGGVPAGMVRLEGLFGQAFYGDCAGLAEIFKLAAQHEGGGHEADGEQCTEGFNAAGEGFFCGHDAFLCAWWKRAGGGYLKRDRRIFR